MIVSWTLSLAPGFFFWREPDALRLIPYVGVIVDAIGLSPAG